MPLRSLLQFHDGSTAANRRANRRVTTAPAGSDAAENAPADNDLRSLAHVMNRSDGPLWTISLLIAQCDPCHRPLPAGSLKDRDPVATGRAPGETAQLDGSTPTGTTAIDAKTGAAVASDKDFCTNREWCPECLVASVRFGVRDAQKHSPDRQHTPAGRRAKGREKGREKGRQARGSKRAKGQRADDIAQVD